MNENITPDYYADFLSMLQAQVSRPAHGPKVSVYAIRYLATARSRTAVSYWEYAFCLALSHSWLLYMEHP
jgi:hypothetical protein